MSSSDAAPLDLSVISEADGVFDALAAGEPLPGGGDPVAGLLATWRADVTSATGGRRIRPPVAVLPDPSPVVERRRGGRWRLLTAAAAVAALAVLVGVAGGADPGSPLWPITRVAYPATADVRAAQAAIADARQAVAQGRTDDARRLLAVAYQRVNRIRDQRKAQRLRDDVDEVQRSLPSLDLEPAPRPSSVLPSLVAPTASETPTAGTPTPSGSRPPTHRPHRTHKPTPSASTPPPASPGQGAVDSGPDPVPTLPDPGKVVDGVTDAVGSVLHGMAGSRSGHGSGERAGTRRPGSRPG